MSRTQNDGYRTKTNPELKRRYWEKRDFVKASGLEEKFEKVYKVNGYTIECSAYNQLEYNQYSLKNDIEIVTRFYDICVYKDGTEKWSDLSLNKCGMEDKDEANEHFKFVIQQIKNR